MKKNKRVSKCAWVISFANSVAQGGATGLSAYDNINGKIQSGIIGIVGGLLAFLVRCKTNWSFQGASIRHQEPEDHLSIQNIESSETILTFEFNEPLIENHSQCKLAKQFVIAPLFTLMDGMLNFSDHLFTWRQLSQVYFSLNNSSFWPLMIASFGVQQSYYMGQELWETLEDISADKSAPFYKKLFAPIMGGSPQAKVWRQRFRVLGSVHHTVFEFTPFLITFPELVNFLATYSWGTAIPSMLGAMILAVLIYDTTNFFEGRHLEEHLADGEENQQPITIPVWRAKIERYLGLVVALFHGALVAAPNYIIPNKISKSLNLPVSLGLPFGIFSLISGSAGSWKSEVAEGFQQIDILIQRQSQLSVPLLT